MACKKSATAKDIVSSAAYLSGCGKATGEVLHVAGNARKELGHGIDSRSHREMEALVQRAAPPQGIWIIRFGTLRAVADALLGSRGRGEVRL